MGAYMGSYGRRCFHKTSDKICAGIETSRKSVPSLAATEIPGT